MPERSERLTPLRKPETRGNLQELTRPDRRGDRRMTTDLLRLEDQSANGGNHVYRTKTQTKTQSTSSRTKRDVPLLDKERIRIST